MVVSLITFPASGCSGKSDDPKPDPILRDAYSLYILDPGPFEVVGPEAPSQKEFLILQHGEVEISFGIYVGAHITAGAIENEIANFARDTVTNQAWLPGCDRWQLDAAEISIDEQWYYYVTILIRRDPEWTSRLSIIQRVVHQREISRFPEYADRIVRVYYTLNEQDIYIFTLSGPPEDIAAFEPAVRSLLASVRLNAVQAIAELEGESD